MWSALPSYLPVAGLVSVLVLLYCRPRHVVMLLAVLFALLSRDKRSRAERALDVLWLLRRDRQWRRRPGSGP
jgi:hypothetical protein